MRITKRIAVEETGRGWVDVVLDTDTGQYTLGEVEMHGPTETYSDEGQVHAGETGDNPEMFKHLMGQRHTGRFKGDVEGVDKETTWDTI